MLSLPLRRVVNIDKLIDSNKSTDFPWPGVGRNSFCMESRVLLNYVWQVSRISYVCGGNIVVAIGYSGSSCWRALTSTPAGKQHHNDHTGPHWVTLGRSSPATTSISWRHSNNSIHAEQHTTAGSRSTVTLYYQPYSHPDIYFNALLTRWQLAAMEGSSTTSSDSGFSSPHSNKHSCVCSIKNRVGIARPRCSM